VIIDPLQFLLTAQTPLGGWGYQLGQTPVVEPTCAVLIAARDKSHETAFQDAVEWLLSIQQNDGGWGINGDDLSSCWQTAWAVWALQIIGEEDNAIQRGLDWLLKEEAMAISDLDDLEAGLKVAGIDFSLRGWPWQPGESSWVEPTALALMALASAGITNERLREAIRYLENRRCPGGGWNVGNPLMFNTLVPARVVPTAWSLMSLAQNAPDAILENDITALETEMVKDGGLLGLAWGSLALKTNKRDIPKDIRAALVENQTSDGSWNQNPFITAVAWMAFQEDMLV